MSANTKIPEIIYHFTSPVGLAEILWSRYISLTESNLNIREGNCGVVWLTSSPDPKNNGLKFDDAIPAQYDKTSIRISLPYKEVFRQWDEWSDSKGMDKGYKEILIGTANAEETYRMWCCRRPKMPFSRRPCLRTNSRCQRPHVNERETPPAYTRAVIQGLNALYVGK